METTLIGRQEEQDILLKTLTSGESEMVAVFGRRRVGKTFLIKQVYQEHIVFEMTGLQNGNTKEQLQNFSTSNIVELSAIITRDPASSPNGTQTPLAIPCFNASSRKISDFGPPPRTDRKSVV